MPFRQGFTIIELLLVVVIIGIVASIAIPNYMAMQARAKEAAVIECAHTVQLATEDFAVQNLGVYSDRDIDVMPCLPDGIPLKNSFTNNQTEPQFGMAATTPGQVGLEGTMQGGVMVGYTITGFGHSDLVISYKND